VPLYIGSEVEHDLNIFKVWRDIGLWHWFCCKFHGERGQWKFL